MSRATNNENFFMTIFTPEQYQDAVFKTRGYNARVEVETYPNGRIKDYDKKVAELKGSIERSFESEYRLPAGVVSYTQHATASDTTGPTYYMIFTPNIKKITDVETGKTYLQATGLTYEDYSGSEPESKVAFQLTSSAGMAVMAIANSLGYNMTVDDARNFWKKVADEDASLIDKLTGTPIATLIEEGALTPEELEQYRALPSWMQSSTNDWTQDMADTTVTLYADDDMHTYLMEDDVERIKNLLFEMDYIGTDSTYTPSYIVNEDYPETAATPVTDSIIAAPSLASVSGLVDYAFTQMVETVPAEHPLKSKLIDLIEAYGSIGAGTIDSYGGVGGFNIYVDSDTASLLLHRCDSNLIYPGSYQINGRGFIHVNAEHEGVLQIFDNGTSEFNENLGVNTVYDYNGEIIIGDTLITYSLSNVGDLVGSGGILSRKPNAVLPSPTTPISTTYPDWSTGVITLPTDDETGDTVDKTVVPIVIPSDEVDPEDITQDGSQSGDPDDDDSGGDGFPFPLIIPSFPDAEIDPTVDPDIDIDPDIDPDTDIPSIVPLPIITPSVTSNNLVHIYNPTESQIIKLTQKLWSSISDIENTIKKLFQDPMDAIVSFHAIYCTPITTGGGSIIIGNYDSQVGSSYLNPDPDNPPVKWVLNNYVKIDCGSIHISPFYGNVLDYVSTQIDLYLPFIGFVNIDVAQCMDRDLRVIYWVDVVTGICSAIVSVDNMPQYTFTGNCSVQIPLSGSSHSSFITSLIGMAGGAIGGAIMGKATGAIVGGAVGAAGGVANSARATVNRGGAISGNAGAMLPKRPFINIYRQVPYNPANFNTYYGHPANTTVKLGNISGYTKVKDIRIKGISATQGELSEIESLLKGGVIL